jgi:KH domain
MDNEFAHGGFSGVISWTTTCRNDLVGVLIGKKGEGIRSLNKMTGAMVHVAQRDKVLLLIHLIHFEYVLTRVLSR